ncbi:helix-turn-helix domain-containing protein [Mycolicibacterium sp. P9-22]|uniref:ArsR/SmtB family transcription factor n=1 Tax=Mycolicibacterium sp. P9-22 TaxID=2024613 RepID=UPI0011F00A0C|nr:helix-turn-helix domain-containing protein [Mycolicibacterium sp. P9-22]KAA0113406.1 ArsR family transcriptional regulator [Mycolicibacterium sp. P9-22]
MVEVEVITDPAAATSALDPVRARLLAELTEPASAATLAARVGLTRQKVNYHLRALERHRLVAVAEERQWGGLTERLLVASAASYVVSPSALGAVGARADKTNDRFSAGHLIALAARVVKEVGEIWQAARTADKRLATLSIDTTIRFRSPADRAFFTRDLTEAVAALAARYHDETAPRGRPHRLFVASYPAPSTDENQEHRHAREP